jgi:predicted nucleic acid-binding protein
MPESDAGSKGVVLDTSILIELLRNNASIQRCVDSYLDTGYAIATSAVCVAELYAGVRPGEEHITAQLVATLECLPLTYNIARRAGEIKVSLSKIGRTHSIVDMMIAATALESGYLIATENRRDFSLPGLELVDCV